MGFAGAPETGRLVRAEGLAVGGTGADGEALGQGEGVSPNLRRRWTVRVLVLGDQQLGIDARGRVCLGRRRICAEARVEAQLVAAGGSWPLSGGMVRPSVVGNSVHRRRQGTGAGRRVLGERLGWE